jgi:hypothetical protein
MKDGRASADEFAVDELRGVGVDEQVDELED